MSSSKRGISVVRDYNPAPDACARALVTLLKSNVNKKGVEPTPERDSPDHVRKDLDAHTATSSIPEPR